MSDHSVIWSIVTTEIFISAALIDQICCIKMRSVLLSSSGVWQTSQKSLSSFSTARSSASCPSLIPSSSGSTKPTPARPCGSAPTCGESSTYGKQTEHELCVLPVHFGLQDKSQRSRLMDLFQTGLTSHMCFELLASKIHFNKGLFFFSCCRSNVDPPIWYDTDIRLFEIQRI